MDMSISKAVGAIVLITVALLGFNFAFKTPVKNYVPQSDLEQLDKIGREQVTNAKPTFFQQVWFYVSSFWTIMKTAFGFVTTGLGNIIFDLGERIGVPFMILSLVSGVITFGIAIYLLNKLRGGNNG